MQSIQQVLREMVGRLAKREAKLLLAPLRRRSASQRRDIASLKRQLAVLQRRQQLLDKSVTRVAAAAPATEAAPSRAWITRAGIRSLRKRLGLSQTLFGKLVGVTTMAVSGWETGSGKLRLRHKTHAAIMGIRKIGAREARARLGIEGPARRARK